MTASPVPATVRAAAHPHNQAVQRRVMRMRDLTVYLGVGKSTLYAWIAEGSFPPADVRLGANTVCWAIETVDAWLASRRLAH